MVYSSFLLKATLYRGGTDRFEQIIRIFKMQMSVKSTRVKNITFSIGMNKKVREEKHKMDKRLSNGFCELSQDDMRVIDGGLGIVASFLLKWGVDAVSKEITGKTPGEHIHDAVFGTDVVTVTGVANTRTISAAARNRLTSNYLR